MDYTEIYKQSAGLVAFSPGGQFLLTAIQDRLIVRRVDTFQIARTWLVDTTPSATTSILSLPSSASKSKSAASSGNDGSISHIAWSSDSEFMLAACAKRGVVMVYKMRDEEWEARIEAGTEGLVRAEWAPDGRNILCFSEWGVSTIRPAQGAETDADLLASCHNMVPCYRPRYLHSISQTPGSR